ncbi:hypothetical protein TcYC6_0001260 [Trypanosoma cruzi]|nr:hypothetical protein TcYC6_0001260 [Trypanosoma cruzi]
MAFLGFAKNLRRDQRRGGRAPSTKEGVDQGTPLPSDGKQRVCFSTRVDAGEPFVRDCGLDSQNFTLELDGAMVLDWPAAPKTARADPHRSLAARRVREQDAPDTIKCCRALRHNEKLTNPRTAQRRTSCGLLRMPRRIPQNGGALRHAAPICGGRPLRTHTRPRSWRDTSDSFRPFPGHSFDIWGGAPQCRPRCRQLAA